MANKNISEWQKGVLEDMRKRSHAILLLDMGKRSNAILLVPNWSVSQTPSKEKGKGRSERLDGSAND